MNISIDIDKINFNNIFFLEPIKNTVIEKFNFIRIIYSNEDIILNGLYITLFINIISVDKHFSKFKCNYDYESNKELIKKIEKIEKKILQKYDIKPIYKIKEQLDTNYLKLFIDKNENQINGKFILKISGIWEDEREYGIT